MKDAYRSGTKWIRTHESLNNKESLALRGLEMEIYSVTGPPFFVGKTLMCFLCILPTHAPLRTSALVLTSQGACSVCDPISEKKTPCLQEENARPHLCSVPLVSGCY